MTNTLLAAPKNLLSDALSMALRTYSDINLINEAHCFADIQNNTSIEFAKVVIISLNLPPFGGLKAIKDVRASFPNVHIIALNNEKSDYFSKQAIKNGASICVSKYENIEKLVSIIRGLTSGKISPEYLKNKSTKKDILSKREWQILHIFLTSAKRGKDIAKELGINEKTVSTYKRRLLDKLNLNSERELNYWGE